MAYGYHVGRVLLLGCMLLASSRNVGCSRGDRGGRGSAIPLREKDQVVALLRQVLLDRKAWDKRAQWSSAHTPILMSISMKSWYGRFPVRYAEQRLIARGSSVIPTLYEITRDRSYADLHEWAWRILGKISPPPYLRELHQAGKQGRLSPYEVSYLIPSFMPVRLSEDYWNKDNVMKWLESQLANKGCDETVLRAIDELLCRRYEDGGMYPGLANDHVLKWLGRIYDLDVDEWLAAKAPDLLRFRREQLSKGYDPVTSLSLHSNISHGLLDEAMMAVYPIPEDRKACKKLLKAIAYAGLLPGGRPPLRPPSAPGWEQRLKDWYRLERPLLQYNASLQRFVSVKKESVDG